MRAGLKTLVVSSAVVLVTAAIALISYASTETDERFSDRIDERLPLNQEPTGLLIVLGGNVTVNLNLAKTGDTIISGSTITTKSNGKAEILLDSLGSIIVGNGTTIYLSFTLLPAVVSVKSNCTQTRIKVTRGQVEVLSPKKEPIPAGKDHVYKGDVEAMTNGDTDFVIGCDSGNIPLVLSGGHGLSGLLALLGNSAGEVVPLTPVLSQLTP
jgi:hypothetical protein